MEMPKTSIVHLLENFKRKPFHWEEYINIPSVQDLQAEFDELRKQPKWSLTQYARIQHIEEHLDKNELVCRCYSGRTLRHHGEG